MCSEYPYEDEEIDENKILSYAKFYILHEIERTTQALQECSWEDRDFFVNRIRDLKEEERQISEMISQF